MLAALWLLVGAALAALGWQLGRRQRRIDLGSVSDDTRSHLDETDLRRRQ